MILLHILFWVSVFAIFHSYVLYPFLIEAMGKKKAKIIVSSADSDELPYVVVLMSVYNEEHVIEEKVKSMIDSEYPQDHFYMLIGSDGSTDKTDSIIEALSDKHPGLKLFKYGGRNGKSNILNKLYEECDHLPVDRDEQIFILTDANVIFKPDTVLKLVSYYTDPDIALVGANIVNRGVGPEGIAYQEMSYIQRENKLKYYEGLLWGAMMGAFGACYSIRARYFKPIPRNFLMEDFYITMNVLAAGKKAINAPEAVCLEDVSTEVAEEFKRKTRISTGNFQNLGKFYKLLWPPYTGRAFAFLSHKVIRWFGPFLIIIAILSSGFLAIGNLFYLSLFGLQVILILFPLLEKVLSKGNINLVPIRFIAYFYTMNFALLLGFIKYLKGVESNVWQPTKRNA